MEWAVHIAKLLLLIAVLTVSTACETDIRSVHREGHGSGVSPDGSRRAGMDVPPDSDSHTAFDLGATKDLEAASGAGATKDLEAASGAGAATDLEAASDLDATAGLDVASDFGTAADLRAAAGVSESPNAPRASADTSEFREERLDLVRRHIEARGIGDPLVLEAMRSVLRHRFVPPDLADQAYANRPLPIGHGQTISQPYIVAYMTALVEPDASDRVLEVGTGSGYQAAVLAQIVDTVYTVEIIPELARTARDRLNALGYANVRVRQSDGYIGWEEHAPFDAIVVTAAAEHIPPPLVDQLKDGGRMIIPVGSPFRTQTLMLIEKQGDEMSTRSVAPVRFVPFTRDN